ncbi:acyl-CoA thioesterase II [Lutibaculum baratangense]|uniref:Acyl-CoA thioesterase 2 n=1 Tax=Lutibaculum baratangense AMV1 TaxID=631454 RepID=V4QW27_9HYPH|nr:acyl-CoA thioesterase II [Lutibaculum baratangense]ESR23917.1 Acyl-CoA thioesterase II [Lutibaculum baratangense AMV1]
MSNTLQGLLRILDLEQLEHNLFRGHSPETKWPRVYGGQVIGQALVAASRTVDGRRPHSLHAYFLLGGDPKAPIIYDVDRIRDGGSFTTRRVVAIQHGQAIFSMSVSFHKEEAGLDHQAPMPDVPAPEDLPSPEQAAEMAGDRLPAALRMYLTQERPIEYRPVSLERYVSRKPLQPAQNIWFRAVSELPADEQIHRCILAYASDMTLLDTSLLPHGKAVFDPDMMAASLDHALWFHRPFRCDEWLLYAQDSTNAAGARGFSRGMIFRRDGTLVASVAQEGLIRPVAPKKES